MPDRPSNIVSVSTGRASIRKHSHSIRQLVGPPWTSLLPPAMLSFVDRLLFNNTSLTPPSTGQEKRDNVNSLPQIIRKFYIIKSTLVKGRSSKIRSFFANYDHGTLFPDCRLFIFRRIIHFLTNRPSGWSGTSNSFFCRYRDFHYCVKGVENIVPSSIS